ncbi:MAG TPA: transcription elongation factor GreA, partial [Desulfobaccales bacterium]
RSGYEKLVQELDLLSRVERPQVLQELLEAAQEGGVENNPDFLSALAQRQRLDRRIKQLQQTLANSEVLVGSNLPPDKVRFNSVVKVLNLSSRREQEFKLVSSLESNATLGQLSTSSPLGRALLGRKVGDRVEVHTPSGTKFYQILAIRMDKV